MKELDAGINNEWIKQFPFLLLNMPQRLIYSNRRPVRSCAGHGLNGIGHGNDSCFFTDAVSFEPVGVTASIKSLVQQALAASPVISVKAMV